MNAPTTSLISRSRSPSPSMCPNDNRQENPNASFFSHAQDVTIYGGQFTLSQTNSYANETIINRTAVFELLRPYTCLGATKDSSARHPPPRCHPGTREKIRGRLMRWLVKEYDEWKMIWVRGFAGTGKSAVAQTFADSCDEEGILGGTYFFFRAAGVNKPDTVVPTLVYQLAINVPEYQSFIEHRLAKNPLLLENSPPVQFRKLIVEPFAVLQRKHPRKPIAVILDGLDECEGEQAQREILDMITDAIRTNPDLPLRWLIFSRPEANLKNVFSRNPECGREELITDAECRDDVEEYVKDGLLRIKATYSDIIPADWPLPARFRGLLGAVDGLFVLASTCLNYIGDPGEADPDFQLDDLLTFMRRFERIGSRNPLTTLDILYTRILDSVPPMVFKTTWRIFAYLLLQSRAGGGNRLDSAQSLCNLLRLDQRAFYKAVRGLHSIMFIPELEDAARSQLQFHHASFQDFLRDPNRSGKYAIDLYEASVDILKSGIYWYNVDVTHFHTNDGWNFDRRHQHDSLPGLSWASDDNRVPLSKSIVDFVQKEFPVVDDFYPRRLNDVDEDLLFLISNIDFRYWEARSVYHFARICQIDSSTLITRIEPSNHMDHQLLKYFNLVVRNGVAQPTTFPLRSRDRYSYYGWTREYFFIGHGVKSVIVWKTNVQISQTIYHSLRCDKEPSEAQISQYEKCLQEIEWDEEEAMRENAWGCRPRDKIYRPSRFKHARSHVTSTSNLITAIIDEINWRQHLALTNK